MSNINNMHETPDFKKNTIKSMAIIEYMKNFIEKTIVTMEYKDNPDINNIKDKPKFNLMYSILIKGHLYTAYADPFILYYNLQNDNSYDEYINRIIIKFCTDAYFNPEKFNMDNIPKAFDAIKMVSLDDFDKPIHTEGALIEETERYIVKTITDAEFRNAFGFAYPF